MNRKRKYTDEDLLKAVTNSFSIRSVLEKLGKSRQGGGNYDQIKRDIERLKVDSSHFTGRGHLKGKTCQWSKKDNLGEILVENSTYTNRTCLKNRLLKEGLIKNECCLCNQKGEWNGKKLVMVFDHINGVNNDNRIENLRMICPNCNSQQETFAGRNRKNKK